jgi:NAD(P)-dependent dehydrogenase (short-subunit alcohol dehydrogenase family)
MVAETEWQLGPVDLLLNNAGMGDTAGPLWEADPAEWWQALAVNVRGPFLCAHAVLPGMVARRRGRILNVASLGGTITVPYASAYLTAKTALVRLSEVLALETQEYGIGVFALAPGAVHTTMVDELVRSPWALKLDPTMGDFERRWPTPPEQPAALCVPSLRPSGRALGALV